jgi:hypothetical protein
MAVAVRICLCFKSLKFLTAAALFGQSNGVKVERAPVEGVGGINMVLWASGASDQGVWGVYGCVFSRQFQ